VECSYLKIDSFDSFKQGQDDINASLSASLSSLKDSLASTDLVVGKHSEEIKANKEEISLKETIEEVDFVKSKFQEYCAYKHLKDLYNKVMPVVENFEVKLGRFNREIEQHRLVIRRFDEVMLEKASKFRLKQLENEFCKYLMKNDFEDSKTILKNRIEQLTDQMAEYDEKLQHLKSKVKERIDKEVQRVGVNFRNDINVQLEKERAYYKNLTKNLK
jgi:NhaP-type Na+/H+ and K+/H+ antiporter